MREDAESREKSAQQRGDAISPLHADLQQANEELVLSSIRSQELADSESAEAEKARAVFESLPDVIARFDSGLRCVYVNAAIERLTGRRRADLLGKTTEESGAPPGPASRANALLAQAFESGAPGEAFFTFESPAQATSCFHVRTIPELGQDGRVVSVVTIARDVTDSQLYLQAREDGERLARLQSVSAAFLAARSRSEVADVLLMQTRDALQADAGRVVLLDPTGTILEPVASFGYPAAAGDQAIVLAVRADALSEAVRTRDALFFETEASLVARHPALRESPGDQALVAVPLGFHDRTLGGLLLVWRRARPFGDNDRSFVLALARNSAHAFDSARMLEAETNARLEAETASRLKDEFLATMSHELRTPLNAVIGWSTLLKTRSGDPELTRRGLAVIDRNARAQARLVNDMLDVSRIISGKLLREMAGTDVGTIVRAAVDVIRPSADAKRIAVSVAVADVHMILADPGRLQQMFWNLLTNAVKFTPEGGHIGIAVSQRGSNVAIEVRDSGRGIDPVFLPHVFERFRQHDGSTTRHYGGLGLGLAIVRELAELHGGTVTATSEGLGKGACFTIELSWRSLISAAADQESLGSRLSPIPAHATSARLHGVRVLLIDDDPDSREIAALVLSDSGAQVDTAQSGKLALIQLATQLPDVIVCDIGMPEMDGYELMGQVRALAPGAGGGIPAIALTGYVREQDVRIAFAAGFQHHIPKPVDFAALVDAIARLSERA